MLARGPDERRIGRRPEAGAKTVRTGDLAVSWLGYATARVVHVALDER